MKQKRGPERQRHQSARPALPALKKERPQARSRTASRCRNRKETEAPWSLQEEPAGPHRELQPPDRERTSVCCLERPRCAGLWSRDSRDPRGSYCERARQRGSRQRNPPEERRGVKNRVACRVCGDSHLRGTLDSIEGQGYGGPGASGKKERQEHPATGALRIRPGASEVTEQRGGAGQGGD